MAGLVQWPYWPLVLAVSLLVISISVLVAILSLGWAVRTINSERRR